MIARVAVVIPGEVDVTDQVSALHDMINGYWRSQVLCAAARLGLADVLAGGPLTLAELAAECGVPAANLGRLMRALVGLGVCTSGEEGYRTTPLGRAFEAGAEGGAHDRALLTAELFYPLWADLTDRVCRGDDTGQRTSDVIGGNDELSALFDRSMCVQTREHARRVAASYDVPYGSVVVDVGGGTGTLLAELLADRPDCRGLVHDRPDVAARARAELAAAGLADRIGAVGGDFFDEVPVGGDLYVLSFVLHDRDDDRCRALLRTVRRAMRPGARLIVVEQLLPENGGGPLQAGLHDLHMLVVTGGRERTAAEYAALLADAGFRMRRTVDTGGSRGILEAEPAPGGGSVTRPEAGPDSAPRTGRG